MIVRPAGAARLLLATIGLAVAAAGACARPGNPRGGVPDRRPPAVLETDPAPGSTVTDPATVIRFLFNERVSERPARGTLEDAVLLSPETGALRVEHGSDWISVQVEGGLRPGTVYRVTLMPVLSDLFGNTMRDPFELVFSTGGRMVQNALAGQALDRVTGRPVPDLVVQLLPPTPQRDTVRYVSRSDTEGLYFFRFVPPGQYSLVAFQDQNRSRARDAREPSGQRVVRLEEDTLFADVAVFEPDSTAASVVRAEAVDSTTVRVVLTDYLDPEFVRQTAVTLAAPEGRTAPRVLEVLHPAAYAERSDTAAARAAREVPGVPLSAPGQERAALPVGVPLPRQELIVLLDGPLEVDVEYRLTATNILNINRIPLGSGETTVVRKAPPPRPAGPRPDSVAPGAAPDSLPPPAPAPDSAGVRRDTLVVAALPR